MQGEYDLGERAVEDGVRQAISNIRKGLCTRVDVTENIKVYSVKNVIRIDIKV